MKTFGELYNIEALKKELPRIVKEVRELQNGREPQQGEMAYIIDTVSPDWAGRYQPQDIVETFDLDVDWEDEWVWEAIDEAEWKLTEQAQEAINGDLPDTLGIGFGHADHSGDYGLILWHVEV